MSNGSSGRTQSTWYLPAVATDPTIIGFVHYTLELAVVSRTNLERLPQDGAPWTQAGAYILLDPTTGDGHTGAYVGRSTRLSVEVDQLTATKPGWQRAVLIRRTVESGFSSAQAEWLEAALRARLTGAPLVTLSNSSVAFDDEISDLDIESMNPVTTTVVGVLHALGVNADRPPVGEKQQTPLRSEELALSPPAQGEMSATPSPPSPPSPGPAGAVGVQLAPPTAAPDAYQRQLLATGDPEADDQRSSETGVVKQAAFEKAPSPHKKEIRNSTGQGGVTPVVPTSGISPSATAHQLGTAAVGSAHKHEGSSNTSAQRQTLPSDVTLADLISVGMLAAGAVLRPYTDDDPQVPSLFVLANGTVIVDSEADLQPVSLTTGTVTAGYYDNPWSYWATPNLKATVTRLHEMREAFVFAEHVPASLRSTAGDAPQVPADTRSKAANPPSPSSGEPDVFQRASAPYFVAAPRSSELKDVADDVADKAATRRMFRLRSQPRNAAAPATKTSQQSKPAKTPPTKRATALRLAAAQPQAVRLPAGAVTEPAVLSRDTAAILALLHNDKLKPGQRLNATHHGRRHELTVRADGYLVVDGATYGSFSGAQRHVTGHASNGWHFWRTDRGVEVHVLRIPNPPKSMLKPKKKAKPKRRKPPPYYRA